MTELSARRALFIVDGRLQASIPVSDRGLAYGDGLFETARFKKRYLPAWRLHLQRLMRGAEVLGLDIDASLVERNLDLALDFAEEHQIRDGIVKLIVTRGDGGQGYIPLEKSVPRVVMTVREYQPLQLVRPESGDAGSVELVSCRYKLSHNPALAGLKHLNRLEHVLAARSASLNVGQQGLVFDKDDRPVETLHHNLFLIEGSSLVTSDLSLCGVAGVLRRAILEHFAPAIGLSVKVEHLSSDDLVAANEVFICNGVHGVTPVTRWQECRWQEGHLTRKLMQCISERWNCFYDG
jgi:4-amino-4-deoxychorismate lyase